MTEFFQSCDFCVMYTENVRHENQNKHIHTAFYGCGECSRGYTTTTTTLGAGGPGCVTSASGSICLLGTGAGCFGLGWLVGWLVGSLIGRAGWLVGWLVGSLVGWMVGWLVGWLVGWFLPVPENIFFQSCDF